MFNFQCELKNKTVHDFMIFFDCLLQQQLDHICQSKSNLLKPTHAHKSQRLIYLKFNTQFYVRPSKIQFNFLLIL